MAPVVKEFAKHDDRIESIVCVTGQHRQMLDQVLDLFKITPDYDLKVMEENQQLSHLTANLFERFDPIVKDLNPDWVLAEGDTTSVLVAALVSYYQKIRFAHVEAGLRTDDKYRPFPEEMNRRIADLLADIHFAPTEKNKQNLIREGVPAEKILLTGNTVVDALLSMVDYPFHWEAGPLSVIPKAKEIILVTAHRRESFGEALRQICIAVRELAGQLENFHFVYPVHLNPNIRAPVYEILADLPNVTLTNPLDYLSMVQLMKRCKIILTDSGGIQEEAPSLGIPVLVMREKTERPEVIEAGVARLVGTKHNQIVEQAIRLLQNPREYASMVKHVNPYGDGKASERIVSYMMQHG
jgi:UDP-N-acetylglucosamine 2-epimerase